MIVSDFSLDVWWVENVVNLDAVLFSYAENRERTIPLKPWKNVPQQIRITFYGLPSSRSIQRESCFGFVRGKS